MAFNFNEVSEYPHDRLMDFRVDTVESQGKLSGEDMAAATGQKRKQSIAENEQFGWHELIRFDKQDFKQRVLATVLTRVAWNA